MAPSAIQEPNITPIPVKPWSRPAPTSENLDWAPLAKIDLSKFDLPGGKEALAKDLYDAVTRVGFWVVVGHGISDERVLRQFSFGNAFFQQDIEEKGMFPCNFAQGEYFGYRENERWVGDSGVKDNVEMLNIPKPIPAWSHLPKHKIVEENYAEVASFHRELFDKVARKLFVLMSIILELPENFLADAHAYDKRSDDHLRYMIYNVRSQDEWDRAQAYTKGGHTDFGSLTLLFSQAVAGLQIRTNGGDWKWVKPVEGGFTCNAADTLSFLTKGMLHQINHPPGYNTPKDQIDIARLGLLYFVRPGDSTVMKPVPSPVLDRLCLLTDEDKDESIPAATGEEYVRARVKDVHYKKVIDRRENTQFEFKGLKVENYYA